MSNLLISKGSVTIISEYRVIGHPTPGMFWMGGTVEHAAATFMPLPESDRLSRP